MIDNFSSASQEGTLPVPGHTLVTAGTVVALARPHDGPECRAISTVLARVGDKWSVLVVALLGAGPCRFNEIKRQVGGISQRMLTLTLRGLERDGLATRTVTPTNPPRVDYALTELGQSLWQPVEALASWARTHHAAIERAQSGFDAKARLD